ncbi:hypothetical protein FS837_007049 [Tulasnella sp. UAMH 9824]|nr:hypothetical protein FS837_007049 [Tulasnella sp. UAMH 9824]
MSESATTATDVFGFGVLMLQLSLEVDRDENRFRNAEEAPFLLEPAEPVEGSDQDSTPGSELAGGEVSGDLVLDQNAPVSAGGFADVYKGTLSASNGELVTVAVKILRVKRSPDEFDQWRLNFKEAVGLVKREALIWRRIKHDFIAPFLGFQIKDRPCLVSLWYKNGNLDTFLRSNPDFRAEEKLRLVYETALALDYLHHSSPPICHADIKPTNVLVSDSIHAQLTDFGLSELLHGPENGILAHIQPTGTKGYQAPELLFGSSPSVESDIFAFGSFIIAAMSGLPPFHDLNAAQTVFAFTRNVLPSPQDHPGLSPKLWELVKECFRLEPLERPNISQVVSVMMYIAKRIEYFVV